MLIQPLVDGLSGDIHGRRLEGVRKKTTKNHFLCCKLSQIAFFFSHMNAISLLYTDLSSEALIKIFQLADLLGVPPKEAAKIYLVAKAKQVEAGKAA